MPSTISDILNNFKKSGFARQARFEVTFGDLNAADATDVLRKNDLRFRCETAQLPSRTIMTTEQKIYGYTEKYPYATSYDDITLNFFVSETMQEKKLFDNWLNYVHPKSTYNMRFKNQYETTITIKQYDMENVNTHTVKLLEAYPIAVGELELNWASESIHILPVVFAYSRWE